MIVATHLFRTREIIFPNFTPYDFTSVVIHHPIHPNIMHSKTSRFIALASIGLGAALALSSAQAQTQLLYYDFNQPVTDGIIIDQSGNNRNGEIQSPGKEGTASSGVSGQLDDMAFDNTASRMGLGPSGSVLTPSIGNLSSFSISLWFKSEPAFSGTARLFQAQGSNPLWLGTNSTNMLTFRRDPEILTQVTDLTFTAQTWYFVTVTYDGTQSTDNVKLYLGTQSGESILLNTGSSALGAINLPALFFGSTSNGVGGFDGWLDDIRIYGATGGSSGVLNPAQIESLRTTGVIPEPSTTALTVTALATGLLIMHRRKRA